MNFFKKAIKEVQEIDKAIELFKETPEPTPEPEEEWIWVEGYKGTDKDMKCRDFQYELGTQYDMPEDEPLEVCRGGFHLCLLLDNVYNYYNIGNGHRFFKVKALVRKSDAEQYGKEQYLTIDGVGYPMGVSDKLTSKSIIFLSELTSDEILQGTVIYNLPSKYHLMAINHTIDYARQTYQRDILVDDGYSEVFAQYVASIKKFDIAHIVATQKDLSMDMKVFTILSDK